MMIPESVILLIQTLTILPLLIVAVYILYSLGLFARSRPFMPNEDAWYLIPSVRMDEWLGRRWRAFWETGERVSR